MKKQIILMVSLFAINYCNGQVPGPIGAPPTNPNNASLTAGSAWYRGGNSPSGPAGFNNILGTMWNSPVYFYTNSNKIAAVTNNNACFSWQGNAGDGIRVYAPLGYSGDLDLFTSSINGSSETHVRFGGSGQVSGQNDRFEFISTGAAMGNYYSTFSGVGIHRFDRGQTEYGRLGTNNFWRFGQNNSGDVYGGLNAARQVEVVDNAVQFRLTYSQNATGPNTDFYSNSVGNLQILPTGQRVGINAVSNPTATLDVFASDLSTGVYTYSLVADGNVIATKRMVKE